MTQTAAIKMIRVSKLRKRGWQLLLVGFLVYGLPPKTFALPSLCNGFLALVNRPTIPDSPCTLPRNRIDFEYGVQAEKLVHKGQGQFFPTAEFRFGLPANKEAYVVLPNYFHQSILPYSGFGPVGVGYKQIIKSSNKSLLTFDALIITPSGSVTFGSRGIGSDLSAIFTYTLSKKLSFTGELSFVTLTESKFNGGQRFNSINPDGFLTWALTDNLQLYGELYGQSKTGPHQGSGINAAAGVVYLLAKNMTVDIEASQRLRGLIGNTEHYVSAGGAILF